MYVLGVSSARKCQRSSDSVSIIVSVFPLQSPMKIETAVLRMKKITTSRLQFWLSSYFFLKAVFLLYDICSLTVELSSSDFIKYPR